MDQYAALSAAELILRPVDTRLFVSSRLALMLRKVCRATMAEVLVRREDMTIRPLC
jgi:hypothetical protein